MIGQQDGRWWKGAQDQRRAFCVLNIGAKYVYMLKGELVFWEKLIEQTKGINNGVSSLRQKIRFMS